MSYPETYGGAPQDNDSWVETAVKKAANWVVSLFGNQAEERNQRRFAQNEAAFLAAVNGGSWDRVFLKHRTGLYGLTNIPVRLPYAKSPSSGDFETPGNIGGWATGPAKRHAEALFQSLEQGATVPPAPPPAGEEPGDSFWAAIIAAARAGGTDPLSAVLAEAVRQGYAALPESARRALTVAGVDYYGGQAAGQLSAATPWLLGAGLVFAMTRKRGR